MEILNRLIPWGVPVIIYLFLQKLLNEPKQIYFISGACLILIFFCVWYLVGRSFKNEKFWRLVITPLFYFASGILLLSFLESSWLKQIFLVALVLLIGVYLEVIYLWIYARPKYQSHSLENISTHINLLTIFFTSVSLYSLITFFGVSIWYLSPLFAIISLLLTYELIWTSSVSPKSGWIFVLIITFIISQIFFVISFLPSSIYVNGMMVTISYYIMSGLARNWLIDVKGKVVLKRYILVSLLTLVLILITAKWF